MKTKIANWIRMALYTISGRLPCRLIKLDDKPYLERYHIGTLMGVTFYLHRFVAPDGDRHVHDHPWRYAASVGLVGLYREEWMEWLDASCSSGWRSRNRYIRWFNWIPGYRFHRIAEAVPETWTLFMHTGRVKGWGFLEAVHNGRSALNLPLVDHVRYVPHPSAYINWHKMAPIGNESGREPLRLIKELVEGS